MATNNYFKIYLSQVFSLAETLVIKSTASAESLNRLLIEQLGSGSVDLNHPETWKYYRNICGEYHRTDEKMIVVSLDTLEEIEFTKENLRKHRRTLREYQYGTKLYNELVNRYKHQEMLILGILYPANMTHAIGAPDGAILSYPRELVEVNEYSFIDKLQDWIFKYKQQHNNPQYSVSDPLTEAVQLCQMYIHLVPAIMNIRLRACRTNEAHSYHVRSYLASHGFLNEYLDHLTKKQALWCYRNINYIERFSGHADTFEWLIENILTERDIPLGEYRMRHDTTHQPNGFHDFDPEKVKDGTALYPVVNFRKRNINPILPLSHTDVLSIESLFIKEDPIARDNYKYRIDDQKFTKSLMESSLSNVLMTKVLESSMYDYADSNTFRLSDILLSQWVSAAFENRYRAAITVTNPQNGELIPLTSKEALYLLYYAYQKSIGETPTKLPMFIAARIPRDPIPSVEDLRKHVPHDRISVKATELVRDLMPLKDTFYSIDDFYAHGKELWRVANLQQNLILYYDDFDDKAYAENMISRLYEVRQYPAEEDILYSKWLSDRHINIEGLTPKQFGTLTEKLIAEGTGATLDNTVNIRSLQKAMISLLSQLSSYSVQFMTDINKSDIRQLDLNYTRPGRTDASGIAEIHYGGFPLPIETVDSKVVQWIDMDANKIDFDDEIDTRVVQAIDWDLSGIVNTDHAKFVIHVQADVVKHLIDHDYGIYPNRLGLPPMWHTEENLRRTRDQSYRLVDMYQKHDTGCSLTIQNNYQLGDYFPVKRLNGFKPFKPHMSTAFKRTQHNGFTRLEPLIVNNDEP